MSCRFIDAITNSIPIVKALVGDIQYTMIHPMKMNGSFGPTNIYSPAANVCVCVGYRHIRIAQLSTQKYVMCLIYIKATLVWMITSKFLLFWRRFGEDDTNISKPMTQTAKDMIDSVHSA